MRQALQAVAIAAGILTLAAIAAAVVIAYEIAHLLVTFLAIFATGASL